MPLTYRNGVIKIQTARTRMQGLDKAVTAQPDRSPHIKDEPVSRQTDQTEETTESTLRPQSEPASPGRRRRDTCDSEDPVAHFAANAPWKCYVGRKRRVFWLFRDQIATRSDFLLAQMNNSETQELYLEELQPSHFDVFVHWVYHDRLPDGAIEDDGVVSHAKTIALYSLGHCLKASSFKNRLIDEYHDLADVAVMDDKDALAPSFQGLVAAYEAGLQATDLGVLLPTVYVGYTMKCLKRGYAGGFTDDNAFDKNHAEVYFQVMQMIGDFLMKRKRIEKMLEKSYHWHEHAEEEEVSCYSEECIAYREAARQSAKISGRQTTQDPYRELTPVLNHSHITSSPPSHR